MSETNYNKGQVAGEILGQRCKELKSKYDKLKASHTKAIGLLEDALPCVECVNPTQSALITEIGEYLQAIQEAEEIV